jgi:hypothetical protein
VLSPQEVCSIIEVCGKAKVTLLKLGDLHVEFGTKTEPPALRYQPPNLWADLDQRIASLDTAHPSTPAAAMAESLKKENERALVSDEMTFKRDQLAMLTIEDPVALEEMINNGELDEDDDLGDEQEA